MEHENSQISQFEHSSNNPVSSQASLLGMDRISTLPDPVVHHIYNFIPTTVAARTSTLSKRFDKLWMSYPILDLNDLDHFPELPISDEPSDEPKPSIDSNKPKDLLSARVKRFNSREEFPMLEKLKISVMKENINIGYDEHLSSEIDELLTIVAQGDTLKEIDLQFRVQDIPISPITLYPNPFRYSIRFYRLPILPIFSWCKSLQHLKLVGCLFGSLGVHDGILFPLLKKLYIKKCIVCEDSISKLINGCPELEELSLKYCSIITNGALRFHNHKVRNLVLGCCDSSVALDIGVHGLERFKFVGKSVEESSVVTFMCHHVICAPNLQNLCIKRVFLDDKVIRKALRSYTILTELQVRNSNFYDKPTFKSKELEKLEILNCWFRTKTLEICPLQLPILKSIYLRSCGQLKKLLIECGDWDVRVEECHELNEFQIST